MREPRFPDRIPTTRNEPRGSAALGRLFDFLVVFGVVFLGGPLVNDHIGPSAGLLTRLGVFAGVAMVAWLLARLVRRALARRAFRRKVDGAIDQHLTALIRRRAQLVRPDAYGKPREEKWEREIDYFIEHHIEPALTPREQRLLARDPDKLAARIADRVAAESGDGTAFEGFSNDMTPTEFETFCAEELRRAGWRAELTAQSRDQGVDVIAEKNGLRVVLQCKLYTRPVGNKSVQEAAAGRAHERAHRGAVVTNSSYTPSAEQLAATNGILLLHYRDLRTLDALLDGNEAERPVGRTALQG